MTNPTIKIHNVETGEVIERDLNETELAQLAIDQERAQATKQAETEKAAEKAALLAKLGISDDEAKLLLS